MLKHMLAVGSLVPLLVGIAACGDGDATEGSLSDEVVNGQEISITDAPWQVALSNRNGFRCGGAIVAPRWVITAQHCVNRGSDNDEPLTVTAGTKWRQHATSDGRQTVKAHPVAQRYPRFNRNHPDRGKDIALLYLEEPLDLEHGAARAIPVAGKDAVAAGLTAPGVTATTTGWGAYTLRYDEVVTGSLSNALRSAKLEIVDLGQAQARYRDFGYELTPDHIPAVGQGRQGSCHGDSGGPLVVPNAKRDGYLLAGVVSWGEECGDDTIPGLYTRVSDYLPWMWEVMGDDAIGVLPDEPKPVANGLVINEVYVDPAADTNGDGKVDVGDMFIEIVNSGTQPVDLSKARVEYGWGNNAVRTDWITFASSPFAAGTLLAPGEAYVLFHDRKLETFGSDRRANGGPRAPGNSDVDAYPDAAGDSIVIAAPDGRVLAQASWGPQASRGQSLVRHVEGTPTRFVSREPSPGTRTDGSPIGHR